ncbi:MAG: ATP-binding cassette domain-containing protein [Gammaproteobacteria bacterium]
MTPEGDKSELACEAKGLDRRFGPLQAVSGIGLRLCRGEVLALLGPNGAGKTTTLSMLTGNLAPHAGRVFINGCDLAAAPRAAKRALGYLPEQPPLYPEMTVDAYLRWCARLHGVRRSQCSQAVAAVRERTGLADVGKRLIAHLSKGYRQRVGIAQAIVHRPALIVLDEPTAGLDPVQSHETRELIGSLRETAGVIFSTHLLAEASTVADRVAIIYRGRIAHETRLGEAAGSQRERVFRLELARPPAAERLRDVAGVAEAAPRARGEFLVTATAGADPREALARTAIENDWGLLALAPYRPSLEDVFFRIVHADDGKAAA